MNNKLIYPAEFVVHTVNGPIVACEKHATKLEHLNLLLGTPYTVSFNPELSECQNCVNEVKK